MDDDFWRALDHLTISSYSTAPVREEHMEQAERKAREFDVVLNVKPVDRFSVVMHDARRDDGAAVQATYDACWLRHRCLVVRDGMFFKCTRAAYPPDFHRHVSIEGAAADPAAVRREIERIDLLFPETAGAHRRFGVRRQDLLAAAPTVERALHGVFNASLGLCRAAYWVERALRRRGVFAETDTWVPVEETKCR